MKVITATHYGGSIAGITAFAHLVGTQHCLKTRRFSSSLLFIIIIIIIIKNKKNNKPQ
jgi:hypothetical protein